jgi:putative spermidine/putrescine transport system permease protein
VSATAESTARGAIAPRATGAKASTWRWSLLVLPAVAFVAIFFVVPLGGMVVRSFTEPSAHNYAEFFDTHAYVQILINTFKTAAIVTVVCVILGYPFAYAMRRSGRVGFMLLSIALLLPFWSSLLVRSFAWVTILQDTGVINEALKSLGIIDHPVELIRNQLGVTIGMTHIMLPYMVLPLYAVMARIDLSLVDAARSLGAGPVRSWWKVFLPLSLPGLLAGSLLTFVLSLGFYITPALLGGTDNVLIGQLIAERVNISPNFGFISAAAIILLVLTLGIIGLGAWILRRAGALGDLLG